MALFQPTNITPSSFSGVAAGTVDVNENLDVSWQVNGNSAMVAYQITFMQNDEQSTVMMTTGKINLSEPFYGVDYKGNAQYFSTTVLSSLMTGAGMYNGYPNGYKMSIRQWWSADDSIEQTSASFFITRGAPTLILTNLSSVIDSKSYTFEASYFQPQEDTVEWMRWQINTDDGLNTSIYDTGKVYGTSELKTYYDGFFTDNRYKVQCTVQTENGIEVSTGWQSFEVKYPFSTLGGLAETCVMCDTDAIEISLPSNAYMPGVPNPKGVTEYTPFIYQLYRENGRTLIYLPEGLSGVLEDPDQWEEGSYIEWSEENDGPLSLPFPYTFVISGIIRSRSGQAESLSAFVAGDYTYQILCTENSELEMIMTQKGGARTVLWKQQSDIYSGAEYKVIATPTEAIVKIYTFKEGHEPIYPSFTLYPNDDLYPDDGELESASYTFLLPEWQFANIEKIYVTGKSVCDYVWITAGVLEEEQQTKIMADTPYYEPSYTEYTEFLVTFNNSLDAGSVSTDESIGGFSVYRRKNDETSISHLCDLDVRTKYVYDYSAASQNTYQYYVFAATDSTYIASSLETEKITPLWWNYTLMSCSKDENGVYHVQKEYRFALDVATGAMSNNNKPALQQNFTRYPIWQPVSSNYRSGTLTAFIGAVNNGSYEDSVSLMQELYELSTSTNTKFLKTRKGEIFQVETSAPISMQIGDAYVKQPVKISIPWVEVGDASTAAIVKTDRE